jgi:hypothetical protein
MRFTPKGNGEKVNRQDAVLLRRGQKTAILRIEPPPLKVGKKNDRFFIEKKPGIVFLILYSFSPDVKLHN